MPKDVYFRLQTADLFLEGNRTRNLSSRDFWVGPIFAELNHLASIVPKDLNYILPSITQVWEGARWMIRICAAFGKVESTKNRFSGKSSC